MFTGIIAGQGEVREVAPIGDGHDMRLRVAAPPGFLDGVAIGASIACAGCCLTAVLLEGDVFAVDVSAETLGLTALGGWRPGTRINLERSLRMGDELGGHMVSGHVDGMGRMAELAHENGSLRMRFVLPPALARFVAAKGSISIDGVSLTVNAVQADGFAVNVIPHTAEVTTLGRLRPGDPVHIEIDMLARYVARLAETATTGTTP
jgi:riboflavin synthase